ncbi:BMC domain-containing protein [Desulfoluna sp.]|uniref:BMC domain-containing protein n=1 Tax=Desulfoluna sp. TaxID=2045199 RepID=UPI00260BA7CE|nr:BMC domain-containing protein [Desulfoluna sp.]
MKGKALGIIETVGLVPAVEAGDVAVKTADVSIIGLQRVGAGLVSVLMAGDVSAVKASVDAGRTAAAKLGTVRAVTVIARKADGLDEILMDEERRLVRVISSSKVEEEAEGGLPCPSECGEAQTPAVQGAIPLTPAPWSRGGKKQDPGAIAVDLAELKRTKVSRLRGLARQIPAFSIERGRIKFARKRELLEAFETYIKSLPDA